VHAPAPLPPLPQPPHGAAEIHGLGRLQSCTPGDPRIRIAVLDGPVDRRHPALAGARLTVPAGSACTAPPGPACRHGTYTASLLFGQPGSGVPGIAPACSGVLLEVFQETAGAPPVTGHAGVSPCPQARLAAAILQALELGAHLINISAGQLVQQHEPRPVLSQELAAALAQCARRNVLVVAAAGNEGCECLHVPAGVPGVLAAGACGPDGWPLPGSNWGGIYGRQGLLVPALQVPGAQCGGGLVRMSGTSVAAARATGVAALLLSLQLRLGRAPDPLGVRAALLRSARRHGPHAAACGGRNLAGHLDVPQATRLILKGVTMSELQPGAPDACGASANPLPTLPDVPDVPDDAPLPPAPRGGPRLPVRRCPPPDEHLPWLLRSRQPAPGGTPPEPAAGVTASADCGCSSPPPAQPLQLVYALGTLGLDFGTPAHRDSLAQAMAPSANRPEVTDELLRHLDAHPHDAQSLIWTLNLDATPIYAIAPAGAFAAAAYERLRHCLRAQAAGSAELVSLPGHLAGSVRLSTGQQVPLLVPEVRGLYAWSTSDLLAGTLDRGGPADGHRERASRGLQNFLSRVYYDLRNTGAAARERALNYAATNAFQAAHVISHAAHSELELDTIQVVPSPVCRPGSECYDVQVHFFDPADTAVANRVYRFTVDVSDVIPVGIGAVRSWSVRG
jgi:cyanobactin maturation PatA/PatG family protease